MIKTIHKWAGLLLLLPLFVMSVSGIVIVFDHAIDEILNPALLQVKKDSEHFAPLDEIIGAAQTALPQISHIVSLRKPRHDETVYIAYVGFEPSSEYFEKDIEILINPYTAEVTGIREWGNYFVSWFYKLHSSWLLHDVGHTMVGVFGLILLFNLLVGLYTGLPKNRKSWKWLFSRNSKSASQRMVIRKLHLAVGLLSMPIVLISIITGLSMTFPTVTESLLGVSKPPKINITTNTSESPSPQSEWLDAIKATFPEADWYRLSMDSIINSPVIFNIREPGDPRRSVGSTTVWINPHTAEIIKSQRYQDMRGLEKFSKWLFPIHNGEIIGLTGKLLVMLTGLMALMISVSAFLYWINSRGK